MLTEKQNLQSVSARPGRKIINVKNGQYCAEYLKRALVNDEGERFVALIKDEHKNSLGYKDKIGRLLMEECIFQKEDFILDINYELFEEFIREYLTAEGRKKMLSGARQLKYIEGDRYKNTHRLKVNINNYERIINNSASLGMTIDDYLEYVIDKASEQIDN
ncbi:hypothetical protein GCM10023116_15530 [Kistimonas scapharcae]|uniref:Uncharacterized protein n=1 Tax=Kistimonas scapharcae TaxID=1036133 RepID=A0ABP8V111_9GAMM